MRKWNFLLVFLSFISVGFSQESNTYSFDLNEAVAHALKTNKNVEIAKIDIEIAKKKVWETKAIGLPQVNAEAKYQNFPKIPTQVIPNFIGPAVTAAMVQNGILPASALDQPANPEFIEAQFGTKHNFNLGASASQLLFDGAYIVGLQASKTFLALSQNNYEKTEADIRDGVRQAYYTVLMVDENVKNLNFSIENMDKLLSEIEQLNKEGFNEEQDVEQFRLTLNNLRTTSSKLQKQRLIAYDLLKLQIGLNLSDSLALKDNIHQSANDVNYLTLGESKLSYGSVPEYKLMKTQEKLMQLNHKREKYSLMPRLALFASYQQNAMRNEFDFFDFNQPWFPTTVWGASLSVPVFSSGMRLSRISQAKMEHEKTMLQIKEAEKGLDMQFNSGISDLKSSYELWAIEKKNVELAEKIYNKTEIKYKEGLASSFELNQSFAQLLTSKSSAINAAYQYLQSKSRIEKLLNQN